nr:hypothetical protein [uncultured Rhodopila sp.]
MDREIEAAARAGLKFWAFVWYDPNSSLRAAWNLYQSSSLRDQINWCGIVSLASWNSAPSDQSRWQTNVQQWAEYMSAPNYQRVGSDGRSPGRPLLFLLWDQRQFEGFFENLDNLGRSLDLLRERVTAAGGDAPYIVILRGTEGAPILSRIGADAIGGYVPRFRQVPAGRYADLDQQARAYWAALEATGKPIVPIAIVGWDTRPRQEHPGPFSHVQVPERYYAMSTPAELSGHMRAAVGFIRRNESACPSKVLLIYSWNECDEGGGLIPTLGDPTGSYLVAISSIL